MHALLCLLHLHAYGRAHALPYSGRFIHVCLYCGHSNLVRFR